MSTRTFRPASSAGWLSPRDVVRLGDAVRAELAARPMSTVEQLVAQTRAPQKLVSRIRGRWLSTRSTQPKEHA